METSEKKCLKITNSRQFQVLVNLMQDNIQLAKCLPASGIARISVEEAWNDVAREVNLYGPPSRTGSEWKKIWCDFKSRTKKKIYENNKKINACGEEGSCRMIYLSELEQLVDKILNFSSMTAMQVSDESPKDSTIESVFDDLLNPCEVKTEPDDTAPNIQISEGPKSFATKKTKPAPQIRVIGKRKYDKSEKQFKLLLHQVKTQEKILAVMQMQATATKAIAEAASKQAKAMTVIADATQSIALAVQDALKHFKGD